MKLNVDLSSRAWSFYAVAMSFKKVQRYISLSLSSGLCSCWIKRWSLIELTVKSPETSFHDRNFLNKHSPENFTAILTSLIAVKYSSVN